MGIRINSTVSASIIALIVLVIAIVNNYKFLPVSDLGDGFASQLASAATLVFEGAESDLIEQSWLPVLHVVRLVSVAPFLAAEEAIGPVGSISLLLLLLLPLTRAPCSMDRNPLTLLPLCLPVLVSGRSVLVALAVGYIVMNLLEKRHPWLLWIGALLANLSSSSVLISIMILAFGEDKGSRATLTDNQRMQRLIVLALLIVSLGLSAIDKLAGFGSSDIGYESHAFNSDNLFLQVISRSTLLVSIVEGQYLRALTYGVITTFMLIKIVIAFTDPKEKTARRVIICCMPGLLLEGLGVIAMIFPLIWLLRGFNRDTQLPVLAIRRAI